MQQHDDGEGLGSALQQRLYQQVNAAVGQLRELQLKYDSQGVLLKDTEDELRELKIKYRKLRVDHQGGENGFGQNAGPQATIENLRKQLDHEQHEVHKLQALLDKTIFEKEALVQDVDDRKIREAQAREEIDRQNLRIEGLEESLESVKSVAYEFEDECTRLFEEIRDMRVVEAELRDSLANKDDILGSLQTEAKLIGKQKSDMNAARREKNRSTRQVLLLAENSNRIQGEMHASLLAHQKLLEELKVEYEEHAELVRAEWNQDRKAKVEDYNKLKQQLDNLKIMQFEDKQQLLREQREVVKALQTQFEEYRQTAEYLFMTEVTKWEDKLRMQSAKYEEEIKYIIKAKDQHFDTMMTAKDAKIMNLIEGTDLQAILIKHEQEIEQLRRSHADDLQAMRQRTEMEQRDAIASLHKQLDASAMTHAKLKESLAKADDRLREANELNQRRLDQLAQRDQKHAKEIQGIQDLLETAHRAQEKLNQEKQDLRHRIVRLKIKVKGEGAETLPNLVKRLSLETASLKAKYNKLMGHYEFIVKQHKLVEQKNILQQQQLDRALSLKQAREQELTDMVRTFSRVLFSRIRSAFRTDENSNVGSNDRYSSLATSNTESSRGGEKEIDPRSLRHALATLQQVLDGEHAKEYTGSQNLANDETREQVEHEHTENLNTSESKRSKKNEAKVKFQAPSNIQAVLDGREELVDRAEVLELARGMKYLQKFKQLSAAYADGTFRLPIAEKHKSNHFGSYEKANMLHLHTEITGRQDNDLYAGKDIYSNFEKALTAARASGAKPRPPESGIKLYSAAQSNSPRHSKFLATGASGAADLRHTSNAERLESLRQRVASPKKSSPRKPKSKDPRPKFVVEPQRQ